jgi:hypothetical protein
VRSMGVPHTDLTATLIADIAAVAVVGITRIG